MKIDFVLSWVDGDDPIWLAEKRKWEALSGGEQSTRDDANAGCRYRSDKEMLRYWFRGVEKFAPWVNKIFFVTCGQKPEWLDENHSKLVFVNHEDYIPSTYLPTFNAITIEMNFQRIEGLSEHFVYFNDDMFLLRPVNPSFFFRNGFPVLATNLRYTNLVHYSNWSRMVFNDYCIVNQEFDIGKSIWKNKRKWFNLQELGYKRARRNFVCFLANKTLPVNQYGHLALPHLKSTLQEVWERYYMVMDQTSKHKFRSDDQVNQWLLCAWNQAKGYFYPAHEKNIGVRIRINRESLGWASEIIKQQSATQICVNDSKYNTNPRECDIAIEQAFKELLPNKSSFEKDKTA